MTSIADLCWAVFQRLLDIGWCNSTAVRDGLQKSGSVISSGKRYVLY